MVAKPAPCWQCPEEQHKLSTAGPTGIYTPDLSDTQAWGPTQTGVPEQGDGKSGALARMRDRDAISSLPNFPGWGTFWSNLPEPSHRKRHQGGCGERVEREGSSCILALLLQGPLRASWATRRSQPCYHGLISTPTPGIDLLHHSFARPWRL